MFTWLVMDGSQKEDLLSLGVNPDLAPRQIVASELAGKWASPIALLDDPKYAEWAQGLSFLPLRTLSATALFS
jgi:hypothetical protein